MKKEPIEIVGIKPTPQVNKIWQRQEQKNEPFFVIRKLRKYAYVEYDFIAIPFLLKEEIRDKILERWVSFKDERLQRWDEIFKKTFHFYSFGRIYGCSPQIVLDECRILAEMIQPIVLDKENWEDRTMGLNYAKTSK